MANKKEPGRRWLLPFMFASSLPGVVILTAAKGQVEEFPALSALNEARPTEIRIVSTEFKYMPPKIQIAAGHKVTLILDNSGAETEHGLFLPAFNFRLDAKAGDVARKTAVFDKPGDYDFICDLPGHSEAGMKGMLTVREITARRD